MPSSAPIFSRLLRRDAARPPAASTARGLILLYHRVAELESDPQLLAVSPRNFAEQLEVLRGWGVPAHAADLTRTAAQRPNKPLIAVTFDDGYADNLLFARPLLDQFDMPATIFVCRDEHAPQREFWWDALEACILRPAELPPELEIDINGQVLAWRAAISEKDAPVPAHWNVLSETPPTARTRLYTELARRLKPAPAAVRKHVIMELHRWSGVSPRPRPSHRRLTNEELRTLAGDGLIEIGGHTATHCSLAHQPPTEQRSEIERNKLALESVLNRRLLTFSYPFGTREDFSAETIDATRDAGYSVACANFPGAVRAETERAALPRIIARNWDGPTFAAKLSEAWRRHG